MQTVWLLKAPVGLETAWDPVSSRNMANTPKRMLKTERIPGAKGSPVLIWLTRNTIPRTRSANKTPSKKSEIIQYPLVLRRKNKIKPATHVPARYANLEMGSEYFDSARLDPVVRRALNKYRNNEYKKNRSMAVKTLIIAD